MYKLDSKSVIRSVAKSHVSGGTCSETHSHVCNRSVHVGMTNVKKCGQTMMVLTTAELMMKGHGVAWVASFVHKRM